MVAFFFFEGDEPTTAAAAAAAAPVVVVDDDVFSSSESIESSSSIGHQKRALNHQEQLKEKARSIAHYLRASSKSTLEQRSARLRDDRVSFFRGKDFYRSLRDDPDFVEKECTIGGKSMDDKIEYLGNVLLHCGLIQRCQRIYKEPRKGRTKRVKYPHYLEKNKESNVRVSNESTTICFTHGRI